MQLGDYAPGVLDWHVYHVYEDTYDDEDNPTGSSCFETDAKSAHSCEQLEDAVDGRILSFDEETWLRNGRRLCRKFCRAIVSPQFDSRSARPGVLPLGLQRARFAQFLLRYPQAIGQSRCTHWQ